MEQVKQIAYRIKELREIKELSEQEVARVIDVDIETYRAAERGEIDFSFTFLYKCGKLFGVDVSELIAGETPRLVKYQITRKGEGLPLRRRAEFDYRHIASLVKNRLAEPFVVTAKYEKTLEQKPIHLSTHDGEEMDVVLQGTLKVQVGESIDYLYEGDSIYYKSSQPHGMIAVGGDCKFLAVVMNVNGEVAEYNEVAETKKEELKPTYKTGIFNKFVTVREDERGALQKIDFHYPENFNFAYDVVDGIAEKEPDKTAMLWLSAEKEERSFSFMEMKRLSDKAANFLSASGVSRGDKVMLVLKRSYQFWVAILALHKLGAIAIPATNLLTEKDYVYRFDRAGIDFIIATNDHFVVEQINLATANKPLKAKFIANGEAAGYADFDKGVENASEELARRATLATDAMLMYFTSGTSSYPKIAVHDFTYALGHFVTAKYWHNVERDGLHFTIADTGWGKAVWGKLYGQWLSEAAIFTFDFEKFDAHEILPLFKKYNITTFCAPPTIYRFFIKEDMSKYDLSSLHYATIAGEALNPEVFEQFYKATGIKLMEGFGQTETALTVANLYGMTPKPGSMGKPAPQYDLFIARNDLTEADYGEVGEIVIRYKDKKPLGLFSGYYMDDEHTKEAFREGVYHTGDLAWKDEDGYLWYVGRGDDLIKSSGYRISPFEIESVIMELPYVLECAVTGVADELRGQVVKATIVATKGTKCDKELCEKVKEYVKTHTAPYKYPRIVEFVEALPKTISGKIRRAEIRKNDEKQA